MALLCPLVIRVHGGGGGENNGYVRYHRLANNSTCMIDAFDMDVATTIPYRRRL
jgi:hypothetical protein